MFVDKLLNKYFRVTTRLGDRLGRTRCNRCSHWTRKDQPAYTCHAGKHVPLETTTTPVKYGPLRML